MGFDFLIEWVRSVMRCWTKYEIRGCWHEISRFIDALVQVLEGEVRITIAGEVYPLKIGEAIILPANKPHSVVAVSKFKMMLVMIRS